jgi:hypothetical protein
MKRRVYRASALAGWIGVIVLFALILSDNALRRGAVAVVSQWPDSLRLILAALGGYLIGSIPIGFLAVGVLTERDVREEGSGRTGGTNAYRAGGFLGGFLTIVGDFLKGMCAVVFGALLLPNIWAPVLSGLGGVLGHNASIFLAFRGGAGTISNMGAVTAFWPPALLHRAGLCIGHVCHSHRIGCLYHHELGRGRIVSGAGAVWRLSVAAPRLCRWRIVVVAVCVAPEY